MTKKRKDDQAAEPAVQPSQKDGPKPKTKPQLAKELGGPEGPEPTRYGDWERKGIASDF